MNKIEYELEKELEELRHKNRLEEIEAEKQARLEVEKFKHEKEVEKFKHEKELERHRLKRADIRRTIQEKAYLREQRLKEKNERSNS